MSEPKAGKNDSRAASETSICGDGKDGFNIKKKYVKDMLTDNITLEAGALIFLRECNDRLQVKLPKNHEDPGSFTLSCTIGNLKFWHCLYDLGASVGVMSLSVLQHLGLLTFKPSKFSLVLVDRSTWKPEERLENTPLKVGGCWILTDFVVLDLDDERQEIILNRPFLATVETLIDVPK